MGLVTMRGMVGIGCHVGLIALDDSTQVALALALMGGNLEATIENFKAKIALANVVCYNELHMFFVFVFDSEGNLGVLFFDTLFKAVRYARTKCNSEV